MKTNWKDDLPKNAVGDEEPKTYLKATEKRNMIIAFKGFRAAALMVLSVVMCGCVGYVVHLTGFGHKTVVITVSFFIYAGMAAAAYSRTKPTGIDWSKYRIDEDK